MPGEWNQYAAGFREVVFIVPETTYGTPVHPAATDAAIIQTTSFALAQERVNRADKTTSRSFYERITHRQEVTWSVTAYNLPSGTSGVAPDITDALEKGFGTKKVVPDNLTHGTTPCTVTVLNMEAGAGADYAKGDALGWANAAGELEVSFVESVATDAVTISPPLSAIPGVGATIKGSVTYKLANAIGQLTITRVLDNIVQVFTGCFVNEISFEFPGTEEGTVTIGGMGKTEYASGVSALTADPGAGGTTLEVTAGTGKRFNINTRLMINAEGANTDEVVLVTGVSGDDLTVTRAQAGTTGSAHAIGAVLGPYQPASTTAGSPLSGTIGEFFILGYDGATPATRASSTAKLQNFTLSFNNNGSLRNAQFGTASAVGFTVQKREVTFSATLWLEKEQASLYNQAKTFTMQEIMIQHGKATGAVFAVKLDRAEFNIPAIDGGGDEDVNVTFDGMALGSATGNDEVFIAYL